MKGEERFFTSLEKYGWKVAGRSPLPYPWILISIAGIIMVASIVARNGIVGARNTEEAIKIASGQGDYEMARKFYESCAVPQCQSATDRVLGASTELEDLVYPERKVERKIGELENALTRYPENKDIYTNLAQLYHQLGNDEQAAGYVEAARVLDPNGK